MRDIDNLAADLIEVQSQLAFQEDTIGALNEALSLQQQEMLVLRRQLALLKQRCDEQGENGDQPSIPVTEAPPPHY